ncbi:MAG TPA: hypothetical protein VGL68_03535 [Solirubrobacteraceae bacterium]|jgi:hypothetical protein
MASASEISKQVAYESERRARLGVPAAAGGVLFLISAILTNAVISALPSVGLLQGLRPALQGIAKPARSARAEEVKYLSHHAFGLIAGSVLEAVAAIALTLVLLFLLSATRFRRAETPRAAGPLVIAGGVGLAVFGIASQVVRAIQTHKFATGHDFSEAAVEHALTKGAANLAIGYLGLLAPLVLALGLVMVLLSATRVGLITRWQRGLGIATAVVILPLFAGIFYLQLVPAAWMVSVGFLFLGRLPGGDPPTWASGVACPWPSPAEVRAAKEGTGADVGATAPTDGADVAPAPSTNGRSSRKRRRKGGARS